MKPDYDRAATAAAETLIKYHINSAPVSAKRVFKESKIAYLMTFTEMSERMGIDRHSLLSSFNTENRDAITSVFVKNGKTKYIVAYNTRLSESIVQRALARELGHIVLGHDGTRPEEVRNAEASCFARHFLCPRALINGVKERGVPITVEVLGNMTGCYEHCLMGMQQTPATHIDPELNRKVKEQFSDYITDMIDFQAFLSREDNTMIANFGTFMDGYEE